MATRILIVDDHPVVLEGLRAFFGLYEDVEVVGWAAGATDAVAKARHLAPDVVLLDLQLQDGRALSAIPKLRELDAPPKVLILTSFLDDDYVREAVDLGASGYLVKNAGPARILDAVRAVVRGEMPMDADAVRALTRRGADPLASLTRRERDVLACLTRGLSNRATARELGITEKTVKSHVSAVLAKLGVQDRTQAALYGKDRGM